MRVGHKFALACVVPLVGLVVLNGYLDHRRTRSLRRAALVEEGEVMARTLALGLEHRLAAVPPAGRAGAIADSGSAFQRTLGDRLFGLRLFDAGGQLLHQSPSLEPHPFRSAEALAGVLRTGRSAQVERRYGREAAVAFLVPVAGPGPEPAGVLQVVLLASTVEDAIRSSRDQALLLTAVFVVLTAAVVVAVSRETVGRPVADLERTFDRVASGDLRGRVPVRSRDELGRLATHFNHMVERLEQAWRSLDAERLARDGAEASLRQSRRLADLGHLAAGICHEIASPLNVIANRVSGLRKKLAGDAAAERELGIVAEQIERIGQVSRGLLDLTRVRTLRAGPTRVDEILDRVLELLEPRLEGRVEVDKKVAPDLPAITADASQLQQVLLNLMNNALDAMPGGGTLRLGLERVERQHPERGGPAAPCLELSIADTGSGIAPTDLGKVFDPFFSTKASGFGTGLGLPVASEIVRLHGGWIDLESELGRGTRVAVLLPCRAPAAAAAEATS
jgi:signal transduction histidine kinase